MSEQSLDVQLLREEVAAALVGGSTMRNGDKRWCECLSDFALAAVAEYINNELELQNDSLEANNATTAKRRGNLLRRLLAAGGQEGWYR